MRCCKLAIGLVCYLLSFSSPLNAQELPPIDPRFEALINEQMMVFLKRDSWQKPQAILDLMAIEPGEQVAEIGAGEGYFTLKLAERVGPDGKVVALEASSVSLNKLRLLKRYSQLDQVEIIQIATEELKLNPRSLDKIIMLQTYQTLTDFERILEQCKAALKPGGKLYIIDRCNAKLDNDKATRKKLIKKNSIRLSMVEADVKAAGFSVSQSIDKFTVQDGNINWFALEATVK